jgi:uncharacterized protein (DUF1778 family)
MQKAGRKAILLGVTPEQHALIVQAAKIELRPVTQFVIFHALQAAEQVIASIPPPLHKTSQDENIT